MDIEDIRLAEAEILDAKTDYFHVTLEDHDIANAATDKTIKKLVGEK